MIFKDSDIENAVQELWKYLSIYEQPEQTDAIFLFGSGQVRVPRYAAELYKKGYAETILITGSSGFSSTRLYGMPEHELFIGELHKFGVPKEVLVVESAATHTGENVKFGMKALRDTGCPAGKIIIVSIPYHSRRCLATFRRHEPSVQAISCPPPGDPADFIPFTRERFALRLAGEIDRLVAYNEQGFIDHDETIPKGILEAAEVIRRKIPPSAGVL